MIPRLASFVVAVLLAGGCDSRSVTTVDAGVTTDGQVAVDASRSGFDAGPPTPCENQGSIEQVACGNCGTVERFCSAEGVWVYGVCHDEGVCAPGSVGSVSCGNCGTQAAVCTESCTWESTGACTGEGRCAPGARTRSGEGCPSAQTRELVCNDQCSYEPASECAPDDCPTAGAIEEVPCGMCGHVNRFCTASLSWEYGACMDEGVCVPGTTGTTSCGRCGTQATRCTTSCTWDAFGSCTNEEGICTPGETTRTADGCPNGQTRLVRCDDACGYSIEVDPCRGAGVDVMLLLETTGSNSSTISADLPTLRSRLVGPLLAIPDIRVGVSYAGDFNFGDYGRGNDRPFEGGIEPVADMSAIEAELASRPTFDGGDIADGVLEALSILSGGPISSGSQALTCSAGRVPGGCWRPGVRRVIVVHTDSPMHNGPTSGGGLHDPYQGITPAPATWPEVRTRLQNSETLVIFMEADANGTARDQFAQILSELGQPSSDLHDIGTADAVGPRCDAIVARVRALLP